MLFLVIAARLISQLNQG